jgi:hypothetical protein
LDQTKHVIETFGSWICGFGNDQVIFKGFALCEEEGHVIMDCPFVPFHIKTSIAKNVELQNVARALIDQS